MVHSEASAWCIAAAASLADAKFATGACPLAGLPMDYGLLVDIGWMFFQPAPAFFAGSEGQVL